MQTFNPNTLVVKEHIGMFKAANNYDIYDAGSGQQLMQCREPNLGAITKLLRFTDYKRNTPFEIEVRDDKDQLVILIKRGISLWRSRVEVFDGVGKLLGTFVQKVMSVGGRFAVLDSEQQEVCTLQGKWTGWEFSFSKGEEVLAKVSKKWSGIGKEMFTSADNYVLDISEGVEDGSDEKKLIIAAALCIDMVFKE